jgi:hypothetical protein
VDEPCRHLHEPPHGLCRRPPTARREGGGRAAVAARVRGAAQSHPWRATRGSLPSDAAFLGMFGLSKLGGGAGWSDGAAAARQRGDGGPILAGRGNPLPANNSHCSSHNTEYHTE